MSELSIRELDEADHLAATGLLVHLNPDCPTEVLIERFQTILKDHDHYLPIGAFLGDQLIGFGGAWIATKIWCGRYLEIDNIVVHPEHRDEGVGGALMNQFESIAKERGCNITVLDSYSSNHDSHRFYHRHGYEIWGFHFVKQHGSLKH